jgi:N-formylglutamate deformylase
VAHLNGEPERLAQAADAIGWRRSGYSGRPGATRRDTSLMTQDVFLVHGPAKPLRPLVLDSPHSGRVMPADFNTLCSVAELRDGEDCFIDELYLPATASGVPLVAAQLLAAQFPRTFIDPNRHAGDVDLDLLDAPWPHAWVPSGKAAIGKALLWRTLDDGRPLYARRLTVAEVQSRIQHYHQPYHAALKRLLDAAHQRFGFVHHINCHSMNDVSGAMGEGGAGVKRADFVLGDRDGTTCASEFTAFVRDTLEGLGYDVKVNDPFKGVELVRAYADSAAGRHSLQLEVNKRLYMDERTLEKSSGFAPLQANLMRLLEAIHQRYLPGATHA